MRLAAILLIKGLAALPSLVLAKLSHATKLFFMYCLLPVTRLLELTIQPDHEKPSKIYGRPFSLEKVIGIELE